MFIPVLMQIPHMHLSNNTGNILLGADLISTLSGFSCAVHTDVGIADKCPKVGRAFIKDALCAQLYQITLFLLNAQDYII